MKLKYRVGDIFSSSAPDIIIVTDVWIPNGRRPIYELSHIGSRGDSVRKLYGYYVEKELDVLKYIEI